VCKTPKKSTIVQKHGNCKNTKNMTTDEKHGFHDFQLSLIKILECYKGL